MPQLLVMKRLRYLLRFVIFVSLHGFTVETLKKKFYLSRHGCVEVIIYFEYNTDATSIIALSSVKTSTV